jgi:uncharacterized coiled-coil protein SlyX
MSLAHAERDLKKMTESLLAIETTISQVHERLDYLTDHLEEFSKPQMFKELFEILSMLEQV